MSFRCHSGRLSSFCKSPPPLLLQVRLPLCPPRSPGAEASSRAFSAACAVTSLNPHQSTTMLLCWSKRMEQSPRWVYLCLIDFNSGWGIFFSCFDKNGKIQSVLFTSSHSILRFCHLCCVCGVFFSCFVQAQVNIILCYF